MNSSVGTSLMLVKPWRRTKSAKRSETTTSRLETPRAERVQPVPGAGLDPEAVDAVHARASALVAREGLGSPKPAARFVHGGPAVGRQDREVFRDPQALRAGVHLHHLNRVEAVQAGEPLGADRSRHSLGDQQTVARAPHEVARSFLPVHGDFDPERREPLAHADAPAALRAPGRVARLEAVRLFSVGVVRPVEVVREHEEARLRSHWGTSVAAPAERTPPEGTPRTAARSRRDR